MVSTWLCLSSFTRVCFCDLQSSSSPVHEDKNVRTEPRVELQTGDHWCPHRGNPVLHHRPGCSCSWRKPSQHPTEKAVHVGEEFLPETHGPLDGALRTSPLSLYARCINLPQHFP